MFLLHFSYLHLLISQLFTCQMIFIYVRCQHWLANQFMSYFKSGYENIYQYKTVNTAIGLWQWFKMHMK